MALLGSILVDKEIMAAVSEIVDPADFYASLHESIYLALFALYERGKPLDKVALAEELASRHARKDRRPRLSYLADGYGSDCCVRRILREYRAREGFAARIDPRRDADHAARLRVRRRRPAARSTMPSKSSTTSATASSAAHSRPSRRCCSTRFHESREAASRQRGDRTGITSGFRRHRRLYGRISEGQPGHPGRAPGDGQDVARTEHGALAAARIDQKPVAVFSLEMTKQELVERLILERRRHRLRTKLQPRRDSKATIGTTLGELDRPPQRAADLSSTIRARSR